MIKMRLLVGPHLSVGRAFLVPVALGAGKARYAYV
jgi:hypothetical protein